MKRGGFVGLIVLVVLAAVFFTGLAALAALQKVRIERLEANIRALEAEIVPLRFMVLERVDGSVRARVRLYDLSGAEVGMLEETWPGTELSFDFTVVPAADRYLAFPQRIFTERIPPAAGTDLCGFYDREGFPSVFEGGNFDEYGRRMLSGLFRDVQEGAEPSGSFGSAVHDVARIAAFETGTVYRITARAKGGIEIQED